MFFSWELQKESRNKLHERNFYRYFKMDFLNFFFEKNDEQIYKNNHEEFSNELPGENQKKLPYKLQENHHRN